MWYVQKLHIVNYTNYRVEIMKRLYKKISTDKEDEELRIIMRQHQNEALAKYRQFVAERRAKEMVRIKEPQVFFHHLFKKS